jgi:hypothetical protein
LSGVTEVTVARNPFGFKIKQLAQYLSTRRRTLCSLQAANPERRKRGNMSEQEVLANQKTILHNQATILENQKTILHNQASIEKNQKALDRILLNQKEILDNQKMILAVAK